MNEKLFEILRSEVTPALGCTGPISVAYAAAEAAALAGGTPQTVRIRTDMNTYKNSIAVVTPGTSFVGVLEPACVGAFYGDASKGLEVLKSMHDPDEAMIREFARNHASVEINWDYHGMGVYIEAEVQSETGVGRAAVAWSHDHVVLREQNGRIVYEDPDFDLNDLNFEDNAPIRRYRIRDFYELATTVPLDRLSFLEEAIRLNVSLAEAGKQEKMGSRFGLGFDALPGDSAYLQAKALAAAASDARMSGKSLSAMSCARSGNVGIAASLPLVPMANSLGKSQEELVRAVCLSYLMTIYIKAHIGRLSMMCACAIAASLGVGAGCAYLMDLGEAGVEKTVQNIVGSIGGIVCDGAKFGCALKLASAAGIAIESARLVSQGCVIPDGNGLVCYSADDTIAMLGRLASKGMVSANEYMAKEIIDRENGR